MTPARLEELKKLCDAATPWPWVATDYGILAVMGNECGDEQDVVPFCSDCPTRPLDKDCDFIAAARTAVPELIAEVERLRDELDDVKRDRDFLDESLAVLQRSTVPK